MSRGKAGRAEFEAALRRIELGVSTVADADLIRRYVAEIEDALRREKEASDRLMRSLDEAINSAALTR
ncbi:hypothetical protein Hthe01_20460 [Hydrogenophilus thermoluteolus]|nr:hypothetical protein Hthe01_20460 [Hydrogenophilus thermoluteolus]